MRRHPHVGRVTGRRFARLLATLALGLLGNRAAAQTPGSDEDPAPADTPHFDSKGRQVTGTTPPPKRQKIIFPKPLNYVEPQYPPAAKAAGIEATVVLKLTIDIDGKVVKAVVSEGAGGGFDEAALDAAHQLLFSPARKANGNPFKAIIKYRYAFELNKPTAAELPPATSNGAFRGRVMGQDNDVLAHAAITVTVAGDQQAPTAATTRMVYTDAEGRFSLPELPPGRYRVTITAKGYETLGLSETISAGDELAADYRLVPVAVGDVIDVVVQGQRPPREVTRRTLQKREIERIPGTNGDALRSIQSLPGVSRPPGIAGLLLVRGSAATDTQTFVDGIFVPIIYHFGGLSSVVPTELLDRIDFYPGNFSARYGRAMGGIVDASIRSPRSDGYHGMLQVDLVDARALLEGPVPLADGWTFAAAGRRSYLDVWLGPVLEEAGAGVTQAPRYYDYQFMVEKKWHNNARFRTSFYGSDDAFELLVNTPQPGEPALSGNFGLTTSFQRLQFAYEQRYGSDDAFEVQFALGRDAVNVKLSSLFFDLELLSMLGRAEYSHKLSDRVKMHLGLDVWGGQASVAARVPKPQPIGTPPNQPFSTRATIAIEQQRAFYRPATYVEMELTPLARWRIVTGVRLDYSRDTAAFSVNPRINSKFDIVTGFPRTSMKGGIGMYSQPPQFQQSIEPLGTSGLSSNRSIHYSLGVEQELTQQLEVSLEGFYKQLDNLVISSPTDGNTLDWRNSGIGYSVGAEVLVKYKPDERFFGWLAYTLSRSVRQNTPDDEEYLVSFDQTHILTMLGSYRLGNGWEVGARFRLVSGNLQTPSVCDPTSEGCDPTRLNAIFHGATGAYTPIPLGARNNERLPLFHALDLRLDKAWQFDDWKFSTYLDVQNAYNNQNVEGITYDYRFSARQYITGIPILPSIGIRGEF